MKEKLLQLLERSYSPYSRFRVAAIVVMKDGKEFVGVNVENASYGATICAERVAMSSAIAAGYHALDFQELHVMCENEKIGMPCFLCRQTLLELMEEDTKVTAWNPKGDSVTYTVKELCPYPFGKDDLK